MGELICLVWNEWLFHGCSNLEKGQRGIDNNLLCCPFTLPNLCLWDWWTQGLHSVFVCRYIDMELLLSDSHPSRMDVAQDLRCCIGYSSLGAKLPLSLSCILSNNLFLHCFCWGSIPTLRYVHRFTNGLPQEGTTGW